MIKWAIKAMFGFAVLVVLLYFFTPRIEDGRLVIERRSDDERERIERSVEHLRTELPKLAEEAKERGESAQRKAQQVETDTQTEFDREGLESVLEQQ